MACGLVALVLLRRRRAAAALVLAALALHTAGCNDKKPACVVDDDCLKAKCATGQIGQCQANMCICTPDEPRGDVGRFSSMALVGGTAYVAAYNNTYGDLMIGHVAPPGLITNWDFVDGVPDESPDVPASHVRGGIMDKGDDVGRYTSIQATPHNDPVMAYWDKTHNALKFASFGVVRWRAHTVDKAVTPDDDVGRWASLSLGRDGTPSIAYTAIVHTGTPSGQPESQLRWAKAKVQSPQSTSDWDIAVLDSRPLADPNAPPDGGVADAGVAVDASAPNDGGATDGGAMAPTPPILPPAIAIMSAAARKSDDSPGIVYYDRERGNLRYIEYLSATGAWAKPVILDGEDRKGNDTGDVGQYPSITFDNSDVAHIAYVDSTNNHLNYVNSMALKPEIVDDGYNPADEMTLDGLNSPVSHLVGDSSTIQTYSGKVLIAYQDATLLELRTATKSVTDTMWTLSTLAGHAMPFKGSYGFYASLRVTGQQAVVSSYGVNQHVDPPQFYVEVFAVELGLIM
jgi:hypothetical protein